MKKPPRYKLLLDENISPRERFPILNSRHNTKHLVHDFKKSGITDQEVYNLAVKENCFIVTFNKKDFEDFAGKSENTGIIAVSTNLSDEQIDKKIVSLLSRKKKSELYGKINSITLP